MPKTTGKTPYIQLSDEDGGKKRRKNKRCYLQYTSKCKLNLGYKYHPDINDGDMTVKKDIYYIH